MDMEKLIRTIMQLLVIVLMIVTFLSHRFLSMARYPRQLGNARHLGKLGLQYEQQQNINKDKQSIFFYKISLDILFVWCYC